VAVVIRLPGLSHVTMWHDEAVEGMMSQDVLRGHFPIFFYGQAVHGVADRYLAALVLAPLDPTPVALKLAVLPLYFVFLGSLAYTTCRVFGPAVAAVATLLTAVPPYYFFGWSFDSRGHYMLMLILGTWCLHLVWQILGEGVAASPPRRFVGLGLLAGLLVWTNYLSLVVLAPAALALAAPAVRALRGAWRPLVVRAGLALVAFAAGIAPLAGYYAGRRMSPWAPLPPQRPVGEAELEAHVSDLAATALPQILGVHPLWGSLRGPVYAAVAVLTLGAIVHGVVAWRSSLRRGTRDGAALGLCLGVVSVTLALSLGTRYGELLRYPRYLLPLYLALPVLLGVAAEALARRARPLAGVLVGVLVLVNLTGSLAMTPVLASAQTVARQREWVDQTARQLAFLEAHGIERTYGSPNHLSFLSGRRILVSHPYQERMAEIVREVDGAARVAWVWRGPQPDFEETLRVAGIGFRRLDGPSLAVYTDFTPGPTEHADLDPAEWTATASHDPAGLPRAWDRQVDTQWRGPDRQAPGQFVQVDLGRAHEVGLVTWLPGIFQEAPAGFAVTLSPDGRVWHEAARVAAYAGPLYWSGTHPFQRGRRSRVEARFPAALARHVRIELTAGGAPTWSIRELMVGVPAAECPRQYDPAALAAVLRQAGTRFAYADHWPSAAIALATGGEIGVLPSNRAVDSYRLERPPRGEIESVRPRRRAAALVVESCPPARAEAAAAALAGAGIAFERRDAGGFVAFTGLRWSLGRGQPVGWRPEPSDAGVLAVDVSPAQRLDHLQIECAVPEARLEAADLELATAADGHALRPTPFRLIRPGALRISGSRLFPDPTSAVVLAFDPRDVRAARVTHRAGRWDACRVHTVLAGPAAGSPARR
jgi:hypothetical protein